jgi:hypothetical protein
MLAWISTHEVSWLSGTAFAFHPLLPPFSSHERTRPLLATPPEAEWQEAGAQGLMALSCCQTMVFSAVSHTQGIA